MGKTKATEAAAVDEKVITLIPNAANNVRAGLVTARDRLVNLQQTYPELAESLAGEIAALDAKIAAIDEAGIASAGGVLRIIVTAGKELAALPKEGLKPKRHAGDVTGG